MQPIRQSGSSVSAAGDVNGDGFDDLIVGAKYGDDGGYNAGQAYVVYGGAFGVTRGLQIGPQPRLVGPLQARPEQQMLQRPGKGARRARVAFIARGVLVEFGLEAVQPPEAGAEGELTVGAIHGTRRLALIDERGDHH